MGDRQEPPRAGRRHGWRLLGLIVLGSVLLGIGVGFWWYYSAGDLQAIRTKAREQGRPLAWGDLGLVPGDAERLQQWQRVTALSQRLEAFQNKAGPDGKFFKVWDPIPEAMRMHHATLDAATVDELAVALDRLGDGPLVLHDHISYARPMHEIGIARSLIRLLQERLILAGPHETGAWARRMLATCRRFSVDSLMSHLVRASLIDATLNGVAFRLGDLKQHDPAIANEILATLQPHHDNLLRALDGEFVMMLEAFSDPGKSQINALGWDKDWSYPLVARAGRRGALDTYLDAMADLRRQKPDSVLAWARAMDAKFNAARGGIPYPSLILSGYFMPAWGMVVRQGELTLLRGRVLAAELRDAPWPVDVFDPTGAPVRAIRRDGRVIAAYSVHTDGIDQGGDEKADRIIPLYAKP
jgi:hypothetical protein